MNKMAKDTMSMKQGIQLNEKKVATKVFVDKLAGAVAAGVVKAIAVDVEIRDPEVEPRAGVDVANPEDKWRVDVRTPSVVVGAGFEMMIDDDKNAELAPEDKAIEEAAEDEEGVNATPLDRVAEDPKVELAALEETAKEEMDLDDSELALADAKVEEAADEKEEAVTTALEVATDEADTKAELVLDVVVCGPMEEMTICGTLVPAAVPTSVTDNGPDEVDDGWPLGDEEMKEAEDETIETVVDVVELPEAMESEETSLDAEIDVEMEVAATVIVVGDTTVTVAVDTAVIVTAGVTFCRLAKVLFSI
jgi:hypothetical protein